MRGNEYPIWNYDGSSTRQAEGTHSEVVLIPIKSYRDPFRGKHDLLVLCETFVAGEGNLVPHVTNTRKPSSMTCELSKAEKPWFCLS